MQGYVPGGIAEASHILRGKLSTAINEYNGHFSLVGSIPLSLTVEYRSGFTVGRKSRVWDSLDAVIDALRGTGITRFQLPDCSWYPAPTSSPQAR